MIQIFIKNWSFADIMASDFGLIVCKINSDLGVETSSAGSELNFNTVPVKNGNLYLTTDTTYDTVLESTFQVCKYESKKGVIPISEKEQREISRWLNRKQLSILKLYSDTDMFDYAMFEGSFNINKIVLNGDVIGYELHFISNRPFAFGKPIHKTIKANIANYKYNIIDVSDEVGYIYPTKLKIKCLSSGDLTLHNSIEDRTTIIKNCESGEIITFDKFLNISSSNQTHKIQNDFNYIYFRIANSYTSRNNQITISIPCEIIFEYKPVIKGVSL